MTDKVTIEDVMRAMSSAIDHKVEHDKAREAYQGRSWGWHGSALIAEKEKSMETLGQRLDSYIDQRIQAALGITPEE